MSTNIIPFSYADHPVRVIQINGEPWFVPSDVCAILGHRNASQAVAQHVHADDSMRATLTIREGSRDVTRERTLVNESGLYALIFGSSLPQAVKFKRWVTHEVLPAIRRTGRYGPRLSGRELLAAALLEADQVMKAQAAQIEAQQAELDTALPKADTWDKICSGAGDYTITDAAKVLARAGIATGPRKLHSQLLALGWIYKNQRGKWTAKQGRINDGCLAERARYYIDDDGVSALAAPQVRVTAKGLQTLREQLGAPELPQRRVTTSRPAVGVAS